MCLPVLGQLVTDDEACTVGDVDLEGFARGHCCHGGAIDTLPDLEILHRGQLQVPPNGSFDILFLLREERSNRP